MKINSNWRSLLINCSENKGIVKMIRVKEINHKMKSNKKYKKELSSNSRNLRIICTKVMRIRKKMKKNLKNNKKK